MQLPRSRQDFRVFGAACLLAVLGYAGQSGVVTAARFTSLTTPSSAAGPHLTADSDHPQLGSVAEAFASFAEPPIPFDRLVAFGDSMTDAGNMFNLSHQRWPDQSLYYRGRFTNGPVWVEWLQQQTKLPLDNYAFAGGTTDSDFLQGSAGRWNGIFNAPGVKQQIIKNYLPQLEANRASANETERVLHLVWVGSIDISTAIELRKTINLGLANTIMENTIKDLQLLYDNANATHFVLPNMPSFASTPVAHSFPRFLTRPLEGLLSYYDLIMSAGLDAFLAKNPRARVLLVDYRQFETDSRANAAQYGITNVDEGCVNMAKRLPCDDEKLFYYHDGHHPTTDMHRLFAQKLHKAINEFNWN